MTSLNDRIKIILAENKITQVEFAKTLGISPNYVYKIVSGKKESISDTLAKLIEERYGYSAYWILTGNGNKQAENDLTAKKATIIKKIQVMSSSEVNAVLAFINTLESIKDMREN